VQHQRRGAVRFANPLQILGANGGIAPYKFAITVGQLPDGLSFSNPQIGSLSTRAGEFSFTITVTDAAGNSAFLSRSITINPAQVDLIISQSTVSFTLTPGSHAVPPPASITIRSSVVEQLLDYAVTVSPAVSWLHVTSRSTTPGSLALVLNASALLFPAGSNSTTINVTCVAPSPCAGNVQPIAVTLSIAAPPPQISLTSSLVSFSSSAAVPAAHSQSVGLQNIGGGIITVGRFQQGTAGCRCRVLPHRSLPDRRFR
jgi:hypothetical protein